MKSSYFLKHFIGTVVFFLIIFLCAGRLLYPQGLTYMGIGLLTFTLNYTLLKPADELLKERSVPRKGSEKWDKYILGTSFLANLSMYIIAGLDSGRYQWSPDFNILILIAGGFMVFLGQLLFLLAQKQNRFFSSTVRIQAERQHEICDTGVYNFLRHPAYAGQLIQTIGFPLLFGSIWSWIPAIALIVLIIFRTYLEDKTLQNKLPGYVDYSSKTRNRILPFIW